MSRFSADRIARLRKPVSIVVLGVLTVVLAGATPPVRSCVLAADWVKANIGALPETRTDIQKFAAPWRRAIFAELSADVRVRLSREHFNEFIASGMFNDTQRGFLVEVDRDIDRLQSLPRQQAELEILTKWMPRIQLIFPGDRNVHASRIFYQTFVGPESEGLRPVVVRASLVPGFTSLYVRQLAQSVAPSLFFTPCNCRPGVTNCGIFDCSTQGSCTPQGCLDPLDSGCLNGMCY